MRERLGLDASMRIESLFRISGGSSRETWSFDLSWEEDGARRSRALILRTGESGFGDALGAPSHVEYAFHQALGAVQATRVPPAVFHEPDPSILGCAFLVIERVDGCETAISKLYKPPFEAVAERIVKKVFRLGGALSRFEWQETALAQTLSAVAPADCWRAQLERWKSVCLANGSSAKPVLRYLIHRLEAHPPPPPARVTVVSGDFRLGNFLYDASGEVRGWLDWEMGHLGDPLEDLTWALLGNWRRDAAHLPGGMRVREAVSEWEAGSGQRIDEEAFRWWSLFQHVKAHAIWQAAADNAGKDEPTLNYINIGVNNPTLQDHLLMRDLGWIT